MEKRTNLDFVFQEYPLFYQPYIRLLIEELHFNKGLNITYSFFSSKVSKRDKNVYLMPKYRMRRLKELWYHFFYPKLRNLKFPEIHWMRNRIDIVHLQHSFLHTHVLNMSNYPTGKRPKIIITLRGSDTYIKPWLMERWRLFYKDHGNKIDAFITVSHHQKEYLTKWGIHKDRIHVIPISFGKITNSKPKKANTDIIHIVSAFRMCWEKNIEGNIRVVKNLVDKGYSVKYDIFGDGHDLGELFYLIDRYNLENYVNYKGKIDNDKFKEVLANYDFYLQLSISESAGATIVEAQSNGVPCIVSDSDGLPEMIDDGTTGYTVPYHCIEKASEKIEELYNDKSLYYKFSERAIEFANKNFSVEKEAEKLIQLYKILSD